MGSLARREWTISRVRDAWMMAGQPTNWTRDAMRNLVSGVDEAWPTATDFTAAGGWQATLRAAMSATPATDLDYDDDVTARVQVDAGLGKLLIIPDAHSHPDHDNARFDAIARVIAEHQPRHILCLGDFWDFESLSSHASVREREGKRVQEDVEHGLDAMRRMTTGWGYRPETMTFALGNHEARLDRMKSESPQWAGASFDISKLRGLLEGFGWRVHDFKQIVNVCGYAVSHYLPSGIKGDPVSGVQMARNLIQKGKESCIVGHSHTLGLHTETSYLGRPIQSIVAGCMVHHDMLASWNLNTQQQWWRGLVLVDLLAPGYGDTRLISAEAMGC